MLLDCRFPQYGEKVFAISPQNLIFAPPDEKKEDRDAYAFSDQEEREMRFSRATARRVALSEVVGSLLSIAITLIAGASVWGYVNTTAGRSEVSLGNSAGVTNSFLNEQFKVVSISFDSSTKITPWFYNLGSVTLQIASVQLKDSAGLVNILYNYTVSSGTKTDYMYDYKSSLSTKCKTAASSYEIPTITTVTLKTTNIQSLQLTIPPTQLNCPSFGQTFATGTTYVVTIVGVYGNSVTYYQTK